MDFLNHLINFTPLHWDETFGIILSLMVVIWTSWRLFSYINLPPVLWEIIAGILIWPAMLGLIPEGIETIEMLAELWVFFLMFHAWLDSDSDELLKSSKLSIALASWWIIVLFILGFSVMKYLDYNTITSIFVWTVLSVTSFPIIARILKDFNLVNSKFWHAILGATIVDDIIWFVLLSVVIAIANAWSFTLVSISIVVLKVLWFFIGTLVLWKIVLPYFSKYLNRSSSKWFTFTLIVALVFWLFSELMGLHIILWAYLWWVFVKKEIQDPKLFDKVEDRIFGISYSFLWPIFFATIWMSIQFSVFTESLMLVWIFLAIIILGHLIWTWWAAMIFWRFSIRESLIIATWMSGRWVMEVIIASVWYNTWINMYWNSSERLINAEIFSSIIAVSILVTFFVPFILKLLLKNKKEFISP